MGLWGDITGTSLQAKFKTYASKHSLPPRERIRSFLIEEKADQKMLSDPADWIHTIRDIFSFAHSQDLTGELEMYAETACFRTAFMCVGTAWLSRSSNDQDWILRPVFFGGSIRHASDKMTSFLACSGISYFPGFDNRHEAPVTLETTLQGTQKTLRFRRCSDINNGRIIYLPLYDNGKLVFTPDEPMSAPGWISEVV